MSYKANSYMIRKMKYLFCFIFLIHGNGLLAQLIIHHNAVPQPDIPIPAVGATFTDIKFNSSVVRITNSQTFGIAGAFPDYSKRQAWNSDETLLMLRSATGEVLIYDAVNYQYVKTLGANLVGAQDVFWHPTNPGTLYFILENRLLIIDVVSEIETILETFSTYAYVTTRAEGNMSNDGHYIALAGYDSIWNLMDYITYDITGGNIIAQLNAGINTQDFDWLSISPLGNYVIVDYADTDTGRWHGVEVYDRNLNFLWQKPLGAGHTDYGIDSDSSEVLIMDVYDTDSNLTYIRKFELSDGSQTNLLAISPEFDIHESCRATNRLGWVLVSTFDFVGRLTDDSLTWLPFEDEVFALNMDGSGSVQRYAHHHSRRYSPQTPDSDNSVYFSEPHATTNHDGTKILWGSNWRLNIGIDTSVDAYIADVGMLVGIAESNAEKPESDIMIFPNPVENKICIRSKSASIQPLEINIFSVEGKELKTSQPVISGDQAIVDFESFAPGVYLIKGKNNNRHFSKHVVKVSE